MCNLGYIILLYANEPFTLFCQRSPFRYQIFTSKIILIFSSFLYSCEKTYLWNYLYKWNKLCMMKHINFVYSKFLRQQLNLKNRDFALMFINHFANRLNNLKTRKKYQFPSINFFVKLCHFKLIFYRNSGYSTIYPNKIWEIHSYISNQQSLESYC